MYTMRDAIRNAAASAYYVALDSLRDDSPEPYEGAREHRTKLEIETRIGQALGNSYRRTLELMYDSGVNEMQYEELAGIDRRELADEGGNVPPSRLEELRAACEQTIKEIDEIVGHRHEWSEDDYCVYCGIDGRV